MMRLAVRPWTVLLLALLSSASVLLHAARTVDVLRPLGGLPAHLAGQFSQPLAFQRASTGEYLVFDRRAHAIFAVDPGAGTAERLVEIGSETGRILQPYAFDLAPDGRSFIVADAPRGMERIQFFNLEGQRIGGFEIPGRAKPRVVLNGLVVSGVGSLDYTGRSVLVNEPERDALVTVYGLAGTPTRTFGFLRDTGQDEASELHLALNTGIPLAIPGGGFYFVFRTGRPMFRKYTQAGQLVFERHIEGTELDAPLQRLPTQWPATATSEGSVPIIPPLVRTAAVDPDGRLWVSLVEPFTYVYDPDGEKVRVLQFRGTDLLAPDSFSFPGDGRVLVTPGTYAFPAD